MGLGLSSIMKLARGGLGPDELAEVLSAAGIEAEFAAVKTEEALPAFQTLGQSASLPCSKLVRFSAKMKGGITLQGLMVMSQGG